MAETINDWLKMVTIDRLCNYLIRLNDWNTNLYANYNLEFNSFNLFYLIEGEAIPNSIWDDNKMTLEIFIESCGNSRNFTVLKKEKVTVEL